MYSTVRCPRALRFTAENKLLRLSVKAVVRPRVQWAKIPSKCPSTIRSTRAIGSRSSPVCPASPAPNARVSEQLPGLHRILPLVDALKHQPHLVGHARHAPFQGHRLPLFGFLLRPVHSVLEPHPARPLQPVPLPGVGPALGLPYLVACLHHILDDVELVVHHLSVPKVVADALGIGGAHVDGHVLDRLRMTVVPQQFLSKSRPNRGILTGRSEEDPLGHKISKHR